MPHFGTWIGLKPQSGQVRQGIAVALLAIAALLIAPVSAQANPKYASIVVDADTGKVLYARNPDAQRYPASLTKMMTLYMAFDALESGKLTLNQRIRVSRHAAKQPPSKIGLKAGKTIRVEDAILSLVTKSANDIAVTMAEAIGGSEVKFAQKMTKKARALGMKRTTFRNASGLPNRKQRSTARDMALLSRALIHDHAEYYHYFNRRSFKYGSRRYGNHNKLLGWYKGADGIKTGYIRASGFNLAASVERDGRRLIGVVFGGRTGKRRDRHMAKILDKSYARLKKDAKHSDRLVAKKLKAQSVASMPRPMTRKAGLQMIAAQKSGKQLVQVAAASVKKAKPATQAVPKAASPKPKLVLKKPVPIKRADKEELQGIVELLAAKSSLPTNQLDARNDDTHIWGIQVGAYSQRLNANSQLLNVAGRLGNLIAHADRRIVQSNAHGRILYRARFQRLSHKEAVTACAKLRKTTNCTIVPPGDSNVIAATGKRNAQ